MLGRRASFSRRLPSALLLAIISGSARARAADCNANGIEDAEELALREFRLAASLEIPSDLPRVTDLAAADIDGDGLSELILVRADSNGIEVLAGSAGASPGLARPVELWAPVSALAAVDLDRDGDMDLAAAHGRTLSVLRNDGDGGFAVELVTVSDDPLPVSAVLAGDLDGDGSPDLLLVPSHHVVRNLADGFTASKLDVAFAVSGAALADLDGDSDLDIVTTSYGVVAWLRSSGGGAFEPGPQIAAGIDARLVVAAADFDGDGDPDLAVAGGDPTPRGAHLRLFENAGDGAFQEMGLHYIAPVFSSLLVSLLAGDLDDDGDEDLVLLSLSRRADLLLNPGDLLEAASGRILDAPRARTLATIPSTGVLGDLDGDGLLDLVTGNPLRGGGISISRGLIAPLARDCDGNSVPDSCDANRFSLDCALSGMAGDCALDCDGNGQGDACETAKRSVPDCNQNGVPDGCELPPGAPLDREPNGIPDLCEDMGFSASFERDPSEEPREDGLVTARLLLHTHGLPGETEGAQGWDLFITSRYCRVVRANIEGTDAAPALDGGFQITEPLSCDCPEGFHGAVVGTVLRIGEPPLTLNPQESPHEILKLTLEPSVTPCSSCILDIEEITDCNHCHRGQPRRNTVTLAGQVTRVHSTATQMCFLSFHRGDANQDGAVDISDPLAMLGRNFLWDPNPFPCDDAFDADDTNAIDITDAVYLLNWLFLGGLAPPPPGPPPAPCGADPDGLGCAAYDACGGS